MSRAHQATHDPYADDGPIPDTTVDPVQQIAELLATIESIDLHVADIREKNQKAFDDYEALQSQRETAKAEIKKLVPKTTPNGKATWIPAKGSRLQARLLYKGISKLYDYSPAGLPPAVLVAPGVVGDVNPDAVDRFVKTHPHLKPMVEAAKREPHRTAPSLYIEAYSSQPAEAQEGPQEGS